MIHASDGGLLRSVFLSSMIGAVTSFQAIRSARSAAKQDRGAMAPASRRSAEMSINCSPKRWARVLVAIGALVAAAADARAGFQDILVTNINVADYVQLDKTTGAITGTFGTGVLLFPRGITIGPDSNVYVSDIGNSTVQKFSGISGASLGTFVTSGSGGLLFPQALIFGGPTGDLYVNSFNNSRLLDYNGSTGAYKGIFADSTSGLNSPVGLAFLANGDLISASSGNNQILEYNPATLALVKVFSNNGSLNSPAGMVIGPDGNLYVANFNANNVLKFDGTSGAFLGVFASGGGLNGPADVIFDSSGRLYVSSTNNGEVIRYKTDGTFDTVFASGLQNPIYMALAPVPEPSGFALMACGVVGAAGLALKKRWKSRPRPAS
jgi:streptogramin lyase